MSPEVPRLGGVSQSKFGDHCRSVSCSASGLKSLRSARCKLRWLRDESMMASEAERNAVQSPVWKEYLRLVSPFYGKQLVL